MAFWGKWFFISHDDTTVWENKKYEMQKESSGVLDWAVMWPDLDAYRSATVPV